MKLITLRALAALFIIAAPLYTESCAVASGGGDRSGWLHCPKAKQCPPTAMVERDKLELNPGFVVAGRWSDETDCATYESCPHCVPNPLGSKIPKASSGLII